MLIASEPSPDSTGAFVMLAGTAVNQGGRASSLTAPNGPSQQEAVRLALQAAGEELGKGGRYAAAACCCLLVPLLTCHPWTCPHNAGMAVHQVQGLQLHGTGTSLGDPIEVGAAAGAAGRACLAGDGRWIHPPSCSFHLFSIHLLPRTSPACRPATGGPIHTLPPAGQQVGAGPQ